MLVGYMYASQVNLTAYGKVNSWCGLGSSTDCIDALDSYHNDSVKLMGALIGFAFYFLIPYFLQFYLMAKI
jgi:hypothetical protein